MSRVASVLAAGRAPESLVEPVTRILGDAAADLLEADPWRLLAVDGVRPDQVDAFARTAIGAQVRPDDPRRMTAIACWLLRRAASDGHTVLGVEMVRRALMPYGWRGDALDPILADHRIVPVAGGRVALADVTELEHQVADAALMLAESEPEPAEGLPTTGLSLVVGATTRARRQHVATLTAAAEAAGIRVARASGIDLGSRAGVLAAAELAVVEDAEALGLADAAALLGDIGDGQRLILVGDHELLPPAGPGRVFADLVTSGLATVTLPDDAQSARERVLLDIRAGKLPAVDDPERSIVVVGSDDKAAAHRVVQLVTDAIPCVFGLSADQIVVVTPRRSGAAGATALQMTLARASDDPSVAARVRTVHEARALRPEAVVAVFPGEAAGSLSRPLVATALGLAARHASVVHCCGPALAEAVRGALRPRATQLPSLLAAQSSS